MERMVIGLSFQHEKINSTAGSEREGRFFVVSTEQHSGLFSEDSHSFLNAALCHLRTSQERFEDMHNLLSLGWWEFFHLAEPHISTGNYQ